MLTALVGFYLSRKPVCRVGRWRAHTERPVERGQGGDPRGDRPTPQALLEEASPFLDVREPDEYEQGAIPGAVHLPRGNLEIPGRGQDPRQGRAGRRLLRRRHPVGLRRQDAAASSATPTCLAGRRLQPLEGRGRPWRHARDPDADQRNRYQRHLLLPEVGGDGPAEAARLQGAAARRRRPRLAGRAVPGRGRRRHPRHHRHGRRRRVEPAAPDPAQHGPDRRAQGRLGQEDADRRSTPTSTSSPTTCASAPTTSSTSSTATTSSSTGPTTSRPATW